MGRVSRTGSELLFSISNRKQKLFRYEGLVSFLLLIHVACASMALPPPDPVATRKHALLIGIDEYAIVNDLAPGGSVTVTSGPSARTGTGFIRWSTDFIWRNAGDPGQLLDPVGTTRAESP